MSGMTTIGRSVRDLVDGERADPRLPQLITLLPFAVEVLMRAFVLRVDVLGTAFNLALALVLTATALSQLIVSGRAPYRLMVVLPVIDLLAFGIVRLTPGGTGVGIAMVFPAIWLGLRYRRRGVLIAAVSVTVAAGIAPVLGTASLELVARSTQLAVIAVTCTLVVCLAADLWAAQHAELEDAHARLRAAAGQAAAARKVNEAIVTGVDVGLFSIDRDGRYLSMNPRHREIVRLAYPDGRGGTAHVYAEDGTTKLTLTELPSHRARLGERFTATVWVGAEISERRAFDVSVRPISDDDGTFSGSVLAFHDVTERVLALRVKDEFVGLVSHELRTPLTSILGYVDVLLEDVDGVPLEAVRHLGTVRRNSRRLLRLVDHLLQTAEHSSGVRLALDPVDLVHLLERSVAAARPRAEAAELAFDIETICPGPVLADSHRLAQVFDNLLENAINYTPAGGRIAVSMATEQQDAVIRVRDSGMGIPSADRSRVFTRFYRSAVAERLAIPGAGLGLAICKSIVEGHGGRIAVDSETGAGSTFEVRLPLPRSPGAAGRAAS